MGKDFLPPGVDRDLPPSAQSESGAASTPRDAMLERTEEEWDALEDATMRVYGFKVGHTLTADDIAALNLVDQCHRDEEETATECYHRGHADGLRERGGDELVKLNERADKHWAEAAAQRAIRLMAERRADDAEASLAKALAANVELRDALADLLAACDPGPAGDHEWAWQERAAARAALAKATGQ